MSIIVCPLSRAALLASEHKVSHAVSLLDPGTPFPFLRGLGERHHCVEVHDVEEDSDYFDACCDMRMARLLTFVSSWDRAAPMLVHCYAGISRSTASAFIAACVHNPGADEEEIAIALRSASATATPNRRFVALADAALGRNGRMSRAIEKIGRGPPWQEIGEAAPFTLASRYGA